VNRRILSLTAAVVVLCVLASGVLAQSALRRKVDSLFVIASAGSITHRDLVEPAIDSIAALGPQVVPILVDKYDTRSARERHTINNILRKIGHEATPHLVEALRRPDGETVSRVCWTLGYIKDSASVEPLMQMADHERWQVRDNALDALGKIGHRDADPVVLAGMADTIGQVRKAAAVAAGRLEIDSAAAMLVHLLGDEFYGARMSAMESLLKLDTALVRKVIADSLESANSVVGNLGCRILGRIGGDAAIEVLLQQTRSDDSWRRAFAGEALIAADPLDNCGYHRFLLLDEPDRLVRLKITSALQRAHEEQEDPRK
jgi:HEAT repeat protein